MALQEEFRSQGDFLFKYRSYLPIIILIMGLAAVWTSRSEIPSYLAKFPWFDWACLLVSIFGLLIRMHAVGHSADNTSGRNTSDGQIADTLNDTGLYSLCRHPLYLGNFFMWLGIGLLTTNLWFVIAFCFLYVIYYERIMYAEEAYLRTSFSQKYEDWSKSTAAIIPNLKNWTKPRLKFSWTKVIRQEKAGILNLFVVFYFFISFRDSVTGVKQGFQFSPFMVLALAAIVWYVVIKLIQKKTNLLQRDRKSESTIS